MRIAIRATPFHFHDVAGHFLALSPMNRFLRFGLVMTDAQIVAYVESLFALSDPLFVVVEPDGNISGVMHLESMGCGATLGLSVSAWARCMGIETLLLTRARLLARQQGLKTLFVRNLGFNRELQRLAMRVGMRVACKPDEAGCSQTPGSNGTEGRSDRLEGKITLADDSLRSDWNAASHSLSLLNLPSRLPRDSQSIGFGVDHEDEELTVQA
jgi:hypothetical protein